MSILMSDLTKRFGDHAVVSRVNLQIEDGELFVLLGSSGSGKSTILRMIAGLTQPDEGRILLHGRDVTFLPPQARGTGFVFQNYSNFRHMSTANNIEFGLRIRKVPAFERRQRSEELLDLVGMAGMGDRYPDQLSGGQQQRVAIARALAYAPTVLLLDEPFGALDVKIRAQLRESLKAVQRRLRVTTILVTHDQEEAFELADRIGVIDRGLLVEVGTPQDLYYRPRNEYSATFIGGGNVLVGRAESGSIRLGAATFPLRPGDPRHDEGAPVRVLFRPETLVLSKRPFDPAAGMHLLASGRVRESVFAGTMQRVRLDVDGLRGVRPLTPAPSYGQRTTQIECAHPSDPGAPTLEPGEEVWIGVRQYHVLQPSGLRLLICVDPRALDREAFDYGCRLAQAAAGPATLLGVVSDRTHDSEARSVLEPLLNEANRVTPHMQLRVRVGIASSEIILEAQEAHDELIVLGVRPTRRGHAAPGSTVRAVLEQSEAPVLLVQRPRPAIDRILICTAGGEPGKFDVLYGGRVARRTGAVVKVIHILEPQADPRDTQRALRHLEEAQASLEQLGVKNDVRTVEAAGVLEGILREAEAWDADVLLMGAPSSEERVRLRGRDVASQAVRATDRPILIVPRA
jgi:sulfate transport system ATP-binding protein